MQFLSAAFRGLCSRFSYQLSRCNTY
jgi:hypothetical protein